MLARLAAHVLTQARELHARDGGPVTRLGVLRVTVPSGAEAINVAYATTTPRQSRMWRAELDHPIEGRNRLGQLRRRLPGDPGHLDLARAVPAGLAVAFGSVIAAAFHSSPALSTGPDDASTRPSCRRPDEHPVLRQEMALLACHQLPLIGVQLEDREASPRGQVSSVSC